MFSFLLKFRHKPQKKIGFFSSWLRSDFEFDWFILTTYVGPNRNEVEKAAIERSIELGLANPNNEYQIQEVSITKSVGM